MRQVSSDLITRTEPTAQQRVGALALVRHTPGPRLQPVSDILSSQCEIDLFHKHALHRIDLEAHLGREKDSNTHDECTSTTTSQGLRKRHSIPDDQSS